MSTMISNTMDMCVYSDSLVVFSLIVDYVCGWPRNVHYLYKLATKLILNSKMCMICTLLPYFAGFQTKGDTVVSLFIDSTYNYHTRVQGVYQFQSLQPLYCFASFGCV